ncbi:MAG: hypothetical protein IAE77_10305 [Prosthecobacter sp.]|jgi:hypothetical protein|uniref:hypothetical protein n=1 Tax=Prosthecobacter sp. TaxID=1965333 RepID=UPI0019FBDE2C|nr:hypothetical protein [Prosthecobacter sp.]MBE2283836.1 hypothetical protein [Prosthecobacter sp.]
MSSTASASNDWQRLLTRAQDVQVISARSLRVRFADGRSHRLSVTDGGDHWLLTGIILRNTSDLPPGSPFRDQPALAAAHRNRRLSLCGLMLDEAARLTGNCHVSKAGLSAHEFQLYARHLAAECDRLEHQLTGEDAE